MFSGADGSFNYNFGGFITKILQGVQNGFQPLQVRGKKNLSQENYIPKDQSQENYNSIFVIYI